MKRTAIIYLMLVLGSTFSAGADEVLDAKLDALKKKEKRRTYSTPALLTDQNLIVPQAATDEEKALDEKLRAMDKKIDAGPAMNARSISPRPSIARPAPDEPINWLTPALFDDAATGNNSSAEDADSWIATELLRQKNVQLEKMAQEEDRELADQRLRGVMPSGAPTPYDPMRGYNTALPNMRPDVLVSPATRQASRENPAARYSRPQTPMPSTFQSAPAPASSLPSSWRSRSTVQEAPFGSTPQEFSLPFGRDQATTPSRLSPSWTTPNDETPAPSKRARRTSPALKSNPFEDDFMPTIKKSIWD